MEREPVEILGYRVYKAEYNGHESIWISKNPIEITVRFMEFLLRAKMFDKDEELPVINITHVHEEDMERSLRTIDFREVLSGGLVMVGYEAKLPPLKTIRELCTEEAKSCISMGGEADNTRQVCFIAA